MLFEKLLQSLETHTSRTAMVIEERGYTYADLLDRVNYYYSRLAQVNPGRNRVIGIVAHDHLDTYAQILSVWFYGAAYVPLHPAFPKEKIKEISARADVAFTFDARSIEDSQTEIISIDLADWLDGDMAYMLFTSGSTGEPKGVPITLGNLTGFVTAFEQAGIAINEKDRALQAFDLVFDVSIQSFLMPLLYGAAVLTVPHGELRAGYILELLRSHGVTMAAVAPSLIKSYEPYFDSIELPYLKTLILTAEASEVPLISRWLPCVPNAKIYNFYGPTEATIYATYYELERNQPIKHHNGKMCIGKPLAGFKVQFLDAEGKRAETTGELCLAGDQITSGYLKAEELNGQKFYLDEKGDRYYRTGDICRLDDDGHLLYLGRSDDQVKVHGYRIELGEIEYHFAREFGGQFVALRMVDERYGDQIGLIFERGRFDKSLLSAFASTKLPFYMVPHQYLGVEQFPLNVNQKIDRKALREQL